MTVLFGSLQFFKCPDNSHIQVGGFNASFDILDHTKDILFEHRILLEENQLTSTQDQDVFRKVVANIN